MCSNLLIDTKDVEAKMGELFLQLIKLGVVMPVITTNALCDDERQVLSLLQLDIV
jgi:hypothetical protein